MYKGPNPIKQRGAAPPPDIPWLPRTPGSALSREQIQEIHQLNSSLIKWSMNPRDHQLEWQHAADFHKSQQPPPMGFTTKDGRVVVNMEKWERYGERAPWGMKNVEE